jgi:radical SAM-linked protein
MMNKATLYSVAVSRSDPQAARPRALLVYSLGGDLRFLSHRDEMRMLERALVRSGWPLRWSQGFNPQPRISVLLPRSVGMASDCQHALIGLTVLRPEIELRDSLARTLPAGVDLRALRVPAVERTPRPCAVLYAVELEPPECEQVAGRLTLLLASHELRVSRRPAPGKPEKTVDVRPYLVSLNLAGRTLWMRLTFDGQRSARPTEILSALGLDGERLPHRIRRAEITWNMPLTAATNLAAPERNCLEPETIPTSAQAERTE